MDGDSEFDSIGLMGFMKTKTGLLVGIIGFVLVPGAVSAATLVPGGTYNGGLIFNEAGSPYVIDGEVYVGFGTVHFGAGVVVKFKTATSSLTIHTDANSQVTSTATKENPVFFTSYKDDRLGGDTNGDGGASEPAPGDWGFVSFNCGTSWHYPELEYMRVYYGGSGIGQSEPFAMKVCYQKYSGRPIEDFTLANVEVANNLHGLYVYSNGHNVTLTDSSIHGNTEYGARSSKDCTWLHLWCSVDMRGNWWGSVDGPRADDNPDGSGDVVIGPNNKTKPWLTEDPLAIELEPQYEECCSSVLFLPGMRGSVLKTDLSDNLTDTLWPPALGGGAFRNDLEQLALTPEGESVNDVYIEGLMETIYGVSIYDGFVDFMDETVAAGTIAEWEPIPYDWRYSPERVVTNGVKTKDGTISLVEEIERLAANSDTGQVTIVAHSMGGLVGKVLIKRLEEMGKADLIDSFVMVGTPQLGTPQAAASLLHGSGEEFPNNAFILNGLVTDAATVRSIGQNMPGAYDLLPSPRYFEEVVDPIIWFDPITDTYEDWANYWQLRINTHVAFTEFVTGQGVARTDPDPSDLQTPEILQTGLLGASTAFHNVYDSYGYPENIRVVQIAGWGIPTVKAIEYTAWHYDLEEDYRVVPTIEGDKTVVYSSAVAGISDEYYFFNLHQYGGSGFAHVNLLNASTIHSVIGAVLQEEDIKTSPVLTITKPDPTTLGTQIIVSTHSPVILGAYDTNGNFTGIHPAQDLNAAVLSITEDIPGSTFTAAGGSQYIFLPKNGTYEFVYKGIDTGSTTVTIEDFSNDEVTPIVRYTDIPTTANTAAEFEVNTTTPEETQLNVDIDGDGVAGLLILADDSVLTLDELLNLLKSRVEGLGHPQAKYPLLALVKLLEREIKKKNGERPSFLKKVLKSKADDIHDWKILKILEQIERRVEKSIEKGWVDNEEAQTLQNLLLHIESKL